MSWKHVGGLNPKFSEFKEKHPGMTMLGLSWALYWRLTLLMLAIQLVVFGVVFVAFASMGISMHRENDEWGRNRGGMYTDMPMSR